MNPEFKHVIIQGAAVFLGLITGGATAYFASNPPLAIAIGSAAYLGAMALGYIDPTVKPDSVIPATITKDDLNDFSKVVTDIVQHHTERLGNDIIPAIMDLKDAIKSTQPPTLPMAAPVSNIVITPAPPAAPEAAV